MRIGIDARLNAYRGGGIAEYTRNLLMALAVLDPHNEYIVVQARRDPIDLIFGPNFRRANALTPCHHRLERIALGTEITRLGLDILHSPDFIPPRFGARRKIITVHDLNFLLFPQFQTPDSLDYYAGNIRAAVRDTDAILAVSEATKHDLVRLLNVPADNIVVQYEGIDPAFRLLPIEQVREVKSRLGLPESYLLFVGTIEPRKNIVGLLEAYHVVRQELPDVPPLVLVGRRGWLYKPIFEKAKDLKLEPYLKWMENVTFTDLPGVYNGAVSLIMPSFYEGFGLPPLEAMACGIPVVVSNRGSLPEIVGNCGEVVDLDVKNALPEALHRVFTDEVVRQQYREAGIARAASFTWRQTAQIALAAYQRSE